MYRASRSLEWEARLLDETNLRLLDETDLRLRPLLSPSACSVLTCFDLFAAYAVSFPTATSFNLVARAAESPEDDSHLDAFRDKGFYSAGWLAVQW